MGQPPTGTQYRDPPPFSAEVEGAALTLYPAGADRLNALLEMIGNARDTLKLVFYIFACDGTGVKVRDALTAAARRGVMVTLIVDSFGADADEKFFADFCGAGGEFRCFSARRTMRYLIRNHQKMVIADRDRAMIGGFNIADDYFAPPQQNGWNDLAIALRGDAVGPLHQWFAHLLDWTDDDGAEWRQVRDAVRKWDERVGACRWLVGGPSRHLSTWAHCVKRDLDKASRLDLIMAYFSPPGALLRRIRRIARRGSARLITAGKSDNGATIGASRALYSDLLKSGVEIHEFVACKMHTKLLVIDDAVYLGSANFDMRSLYINLEIMLRVEDAAFAARVREFVAQHLDGTTEITREGHRERNTLMNRLRWNFSWLLVSAIDYTVSRRLNLGL
ncbi:cardiolipin synthase B [Erythrobacter sp. 3-20A1M]|uniref:phospholipase D-like domain-containing protein n=1 Tax=Erythrobacter sp. 3-20A1M TaxID=2653850 RepID=UPI001BFC75AB|nr:phospholipase D-like domain-containing protein [Erythrobacter sp. 3-20A1M]QWC56637.1 cardiolipin synthase B [Erythrobacter sp. 3-20A1M]